MFDVVFRPFDDKIASSTHETPMAAHAEKDRVCTDPRARKHRNVLTKEPGRTQLCIVSPPTLGKTYAEDDEKQSLPQGFLSIFLHAAVTGGGEMVSQRRWNSDP